LTAPSLVLKAAPIRGLVCLTLWQPGDLGVLEGVADGVWKDARTRGFASLSLDRFAFV